MNITELTTLFTEKKYLLKMGAGSLSRRYKTSKELINQAKALTKKKVKLPKILILDIETAPLRAYVWSRWKQNVYLEQTISEWFMLTWSAKWLFSPDILSNRLTGEEVLNEDDKRITKNLWKLLDEADIIVAHNGDSFDIPKINSRFIINGLPPASPYLTVDTKKISAKQFGFSSNKLDALAGYFGFKVKLDTDFELWSKCMQGDEESLKYMEIYNNHDVELLEEVYLKLRPWIKSHPNVGLYMELDVPVCSNCGSTKLTPLKKSYYTQTGKYETFRCECGAIGRKRTTTLDKETRKVLTIGLAT